MSVTMLIKVNTADKEELKKIPGVGGRVARLLIQFREVYGVIKKEALNLALWGKLPAEALEMIDFSVPRQKDPFDIDLSCLPPVPKTNSWEPLVSFAHQTAARQSRYQVGESFAMSGSHFAEQESSPKLADASSMHKSQESRFCRTDSRPVNHYDEEDAKPSVSKTSSSKSADHSSRKTYSEVEKKEQNCIRVEDTFKSEAFQNITEVWGLVDPNLPRHRVLPQGQGHRQVEDIQGNTTLKGRVDVTGKGQVQSLGQGHTQVQCRGQDQSSVIQGSLRKMVRRKRNMILRHQLQGQGQLNIIQENWTQKL